MARRLRAGLRRASRPSVSRCLSWFDSAQLDKELLAHGRRLGYRAYVLAVPCIGEGATGPVPEESAVMGLSRHCEVLAYSGHRRVVRVLSARGQRRAVAALALSERDESFLKRSLARSRIRLLCKVPFDVLIPQAEAKVEERLVAAKEQAPGEVGQPEAVQERPWAGSLAYRFREDSSALLRKAQASFEKFCSGGGRKELLGAMRAIHKLKGLAIMFGLEPAARVSYAIAWALETMLDSADAARDEALRWVRAGTKLLGRLISASEASSALERKIDQLLSRLAGPVERYASKPLLLDEPNEEQLAEAVELDPMLLACASAFEKRLLLDAVQQGKSCYVVTVAPSEGILQTSFDPLDLYGMLEVAGDVLLNLPILDEVPEITEYDVEKYYFRFKFLIASEFSLTELRDILATFYEIGTVEVAQCDRSKPSRCRTCEVERERFDLEEEAWPPSSGER